MLPFFLSLLAGIFLGYLLRRKEKIFSVDKILSFIVILLIFFTGIKIGSTNEIKSMGNIWFESIIFSIFSIFCSILIAMFIEKFYWRKKNVYNKSNNSSY
ncbi:MAG: LysO family transporter [Nitrososphaerota archaeon]